LFVAIGILGATVMPHNLYLHSALVQSRQIGRDRASKAQACKYNLIDSTLALNVAFFVNAAILVLSASVFHGKADVASIEEAHKLLAPLLHTAAPILFGVALLCAGQSSTLTGTLAGQIIMEGYLDLKIAPWLRRMITRSVALVPAVLTIVLVGEHATQHLLVLSQVILSLQLAFAVIPLIHFTSNRRNMGECETGLGQDRRMGRTGRRIRPEPRPVAALVDRRRSALRSRVLSPRLTGLDHDQAIREAITRLENDPHPRPRMGGRLSTSPGLKRAGESEPFPHIGISCSVVSILGEAHRPNGIVRHIEIIVVRNSRQIV
jgi:Mn2+/Fe2+ NRAMP family transporter